MPGTMSPDQNKSTVCDLAGVFILFRLDTECYHWIPELSQMMLDLALEDEKMNYLVNFTRGHQQSMI